MLKRLVVALALTGLCLPPAMAGEAADLLRGALYEGQAATAYEQLQPLADVGERRRSSRLD